MSFFSFHHLSQTVEPKCWQTTNQDSSTQIDLNTDSESILNLRQICLKYLLKIIDLVRDEFIMRTAFVV